MNGGSFTLDKLTWIMKNHRTNYVNKTLFSFLSPNTRHTKTNMFSSLIEIEMFFFLSSPWLIGMNINTLINPHVCIHIRMIKWKKKLWAHLGDFIDIFDKQFGFVLITKVTALYLIALVFFRCFLLRFHNIWNIIIMSEQLINPFVFYYIFAGNVWCMMLSTKKKKKKKKQQQQRRSETRFHCLPDKCIPQRDIREVLDDGLFLLLFISVGCNAFCYWLYGAQHI